jgi:hypothetical protein
MTSGAGGCVVALAPALAAGDAPEARPEADAGCEAEAAWALPPPAALDPQPAIISTAAAPAAQ